MMKTSVSIAAITVILTTATVRADRMAWVNSKRPLVTLELALQLCMGDIRERYPDSVGDSENTGNREYVVQGVGPTPFSPPSDPAQRLAQGPTPKANLAAHLPGPPGEGNR
jgi:hypothetical protein